MKSLFVIAVAMSIAVGVASAAPPDHSAPRQPASNMGVGWAFLYGYQGVRAETFLPEVRRLGGGFAKVYLFWNQIEPEPDRFDWSAVDAFVDQLQAPDEGLIAIFSSSTWATAQSTTMVPASPVKRLDDYYRFVHDMVSRYQGRVRYWQNDCEPNNPVFWAGSKEEFVEQLKVFYRAVKDADPAAIVVAGGYDGLFSPPGMPPMHNQETGLAFFDYVLDKGRDAFDVFDLRLYADPYTIPGRVETIRSKMQELGYTRPIVATEYGGPGFFEFAANREYIPLVAAWSQAAAGGVANQPAGSSISDLYEKMDQLAPETQMFLMGCPQHLDEKYRRLEAREIAIRNILARSAGVEHTAYWQLIELTLPRDNFMQLMYGKIGLVAFENGTLVERQPLTDAFRRTADMLAGVDRVRRADVPEHDDVYLFELHRGSDRPAHVVWQRRDTFQGEDQPATRISLPWTSGSVEATDILGNQVEAKASRNKLAISVSVTPIVLRPNPQE